MKRIISLLLTLALLAGSVVIFASCGAPKDEGAEIKVYLSDNVYDFDPTAYYADSNAEQVMSLLYEPLFSLNEKGELKYAAASKYVVDEAERKIVITLRETYWSDTTRVLASDFIYAWRDVILEPNNANPAAALLFDIENARDIKNGEESIYEFGAVASDDYELTISYREGADYKQLLKNLAALPTSPLRESVITEYNSGYWSKLINSAVTNGPFKLADVEDGNFTVARNVGYHQSPTVENPTKQVTPNKLIKFTNSSDMSFNLTYEDIEKKVVFYMGDASLADRKSNKDSALVADDLSTYTYVFNTENPIFENEKVRQALSLAIDRAKIVEAVTFGKAATGFLPDNVLDNATGNSFRGKALISADAKLSEARALLEDVDFTGISKSFTLSVSDNEEELAIAKIVADAWKSLGFTVKVEALDSVSYKIKDFTNTDVSFKDSAVQNTVISAARGARDFDVIGIDWQMYSTDAFVALSAFAKGFSGAGCDFENNEKLVSFGGWSDVDYDKLINEAFNAASDEARSEALHDAEELLVESGCVIPIIYNQTFAFVSSELSGVAFDGMGNIVFTKVKQKNYEEYLD